MSSGAVLLAVLFSVLAVAEHELSPSSFSTTEFSQRVTSADFLTPKKLFFRPETDEEAALRKAGSKEFVERYKEDETAFQGYVLFGDPFDKEKRTVSFLLGTDCSHFVHRVYGLLGAKYPYAKTRHFIDLAESRKIGLTPQLFYLSRAESGNPISMSGTVWNRFSESFKIVEDSEIAPGDLIVEAKTKNKDGEKWGHVAMVKQTSPLRVIHAKDEDSGIVEEGYDLSKAPTHYVFRYVGELESEPAYRCIVRRD